MRFLKKYGESEAPEFVDVPEVSGPDLPPDEGDVGGVESFYDDALKPLNVEKENE